MTRAAFACLLFFFACVRDPAALEESCEAGRTMCSGVCVDIENDRAHCGACGQACPQDQLCSLAMCATECFGGTEQCGDRCIDPKVDPMHCGGCDRACGAGEQCNQGLCSGCTNGAKDGAESDIDCGGPVCQKCESGNGCMVASDCASNLCMSGSCAPCGMIDDCVAGENCNGGVCQPALESCGEQKAAHGSPDGEYWILSGTEAIRVYCDMLLEVVLCSEMEEEHQGVTREGSMLEYAMKSVLDTTAGVCELWALRAVSDGYPIEGLAMVQGQQLDTCQALGFVSQVSQDGCPYGSSYTNCGFPVAELYRYGNNCSGCALNDGQHATYVLQGPMGTAGVATTMDGSSRLRCRVRP